MWKNLISNGLDIFFPQFCLSCGREGNYLCQDCQGLLEISTFHRPHPVQNLKDLYIGLSYQNPLVKNLIQKFKYEPFVKELAKPLSSLIISHFQLLDNQPDFSEYILAPVPLSKKRLKWRGYNQSEELGKELADFFKIPLVFNCLAKIKETPPQMELEGEARKENVRGVFLVKNNELIRGRKILLVDDVYTTGSTMKEAAKVLKEAGAKKIVGIALAGG